MPCPYYRQPKSQANCGFCTDGTVTAPIPTPKYRARFCFSITDCRMQCPIYSAIKARRTRSDKLFQGVINTVRRRLGAFLHT